MADPTSKIVRESSGVLSGTRAVDGDGRLLVLRHATNRVFSRFERTSDIGFHFGSSAQARKRVANMVSRGEGSASDAWRTVTCVLAVRNPLVIPDDPGAWNPRWMTSTLCGFLDDGDRAAIRGFERELAARAAGSPVTDREEALLSEWNATLRAALERGGHDGIVYRNVFESSGRAIEWSWVVFDDAQAVRVPHTDADGLDPARQARAMALWRAEGLADAYRQGARRLDAWAAGADALPLAAAARESFVLGDDAIRRIVFDPMLPAPLADEAGRRGFIDAAIRFDALGRRIWSRFLGGIGGGA